MWELIAQSESVFSIVSSVSSGSVNPSQRGDIETAAIQQMIRQEHVVERGPSVCMFPDPTVIYGGEVGLADDKKTTPGVASDKAGLTSSPLPRTQRIRTRRKPCDPARQAFFQTLTQSMQ